MKNVEDTTLSNVLQFTNRIGLDNHSYYWSAHVIVLLVRCNV